MESAEGDTVLVGLGANLGDAAAALRTAAARLTELGGGPRRVRASSLWRSEPVDCPPGSPSFLNAAVAFPAPRGITPEALLGILKDLERHHGRRRDGVRNAPRTLDLDLLAFGPLRRDTAELVLPHPRATARAFVLAPCAEVAPDFPWPGTEGTVAGLLAALPAPLGVERVGPLRPDVP
ncbi:MAG: 2-amino-4-hydroxy-6-hydroxymethyldihydropteridine diphosphokinase [Pseudomonadales bacterium]|jgi:2-amino-4-hydroxy-6-hydroxymethyldihydropteridine diphosphokinase|nr:2-amino-4-hydroxy-6-hydroxymethyldihydropteridine diphosphokinase [Pseudomonadales bacterium]